MEGYLSAVVFFHEFKERGYIGITSILRKIIHPFRKHHV